MESGPMEREAHKARSFEEADCWDREQQHAMTPDERFAIVRALLERVYGPDVPDVRAAERER